MYFSDKELGKKDRISEEITIEIWNGIVAVYEKFKSNNSFSKNFPEKCNDNGRICGFDEVMFNDKLKSEIPNINIPIKRIKINQFDNVLLGTKNSTSELSNKYAILDFIQFCYKNIYKAKNADYHNFFQHYHLNFDSSEELQYEFRSEVNNIFERNGIVFFIDENGEIKRSLAPKMESMINKIYNTKDDRLNELVHLANNKFVSPNYEDRIHALEKIWDAFERVKTYYGESKKQSAEQLIHTIANSNSKFEEIINEESKSLTNIGNNFQIRHFERGKIEISDNQHIDYLFYRMITLIHLFLTKLEQD